jgi:RimJ/RimL family protein N-acetyltransferase
MDRRDCLIFSVLDKNTQNLIGNASLQNIDLVNRKCNIAITLGNPTGVSAAVEVFGLLLEHAFCRLNLNRVGDATHEKLSTLVKMLSVLGFKEEGRLREYFIRDGMCSDAVSFSVLQRDFMALRADRAGGILFDTLDKLNLAILSAVKASNDVSSSKFCLREYKSD